MALVNLDKRLELRVHVAPVGAHPRCRGVRCADAVMFFQVIIKHWRIRIHNAPLADQPRECATPRWSNITLRWPCG